MELPFAESWKIKMVEPIRKSTDRKSTRLNSSHNA